MEKIADREIIIVEEAYFTFEFLSLILSNNIFIGHIF